MDWRTTIHANRLLAIFQECFHMYYSWKIVRKPFACMVNLQSFGIGLLLLMCLFTFEVQSNRLFAPTSQSRMSKFLEIFNPWGKSNGKKWSRIGKLLLKKGVKSRRKIKFAFLANFALLSRIFLVLLFLTPFNSIFAPTSQSPMCKLFRFSESLEKVRERNGLRVENFCS